MKIHWAIPLLMTVLTLVGCGTRTPYFLIESKLVENQRRLGEPDVTETPTFRSVRGNFRTLGLQPPDLCADQGQVATGGTGRLQQGILRTRCGVEMAEFERALARAGFDVVSWDAIRGVSNSEKRSILDSAKNLGIELLLQVNALERIETQPGRDARLERRFYRATRAGERADSARVDRSLAKQFEMLIRPREASLVEGKRVAATINVSAVWVKTGAAIWFYEATGIDETSTSPKAEILLDCEKSGCKEVSTTISNTPDGPVDGSISGISIAGDPEDEAQAIFHELVRSLVSDLAERLAGR